MEYSPFELNYYLIDCKNGTGFNAYKDLPHTKILSVSNDREFGASSMTTLFLLNHYHFYLETKVGTIVFQKQ
jgi:hypothetical protein